jgi:hypothetical protein
MKITCSSLLAVAVVSFVASLSYAATFKTDVYVTADDKGIITISGGDGIVTLMQFCPDEWVDGCDNNITIKREGNSLVLDKDGLGHHQTAFNFRDASGKWLLIPNKAQVRADLNVEIVEKTAKKTGEKKSYFKYTGAAAKK